MCVDGMQMQKEIEGGNGAKTRSRSTMTESSSTSRAQRGVLHKAYRCKTVAATREGRKQL